MKKSFIIALCIVIGIPVVYVASLPYQCNLKKNELISKNQTAIDDIDKVALLGESPAQKSEVFASPWCPGDLTGEDYISVEKKYSKTMNGGEAIDTMRNSLVQAGYAVENEYFGIDWGCKLTYSAKASKGDRAFGVFIDQKNLRDPACTNTNSFKKVSEAYFRTLNVDSESLHWSNP